MKGFNRWLALVHASLLGILASFLGCTEEPEDGQDGGAGFPGRPGLTVRP